MRKTFPGEKRSCRVLSRLSVCARCLRLRLSLISLAHLSPYRLPCVPNLALIEQLAGHEHCVHALLKWAIAQKGAGATVAVIDHVAPLRVAGDAKRPGTALSAAIANGRLAVAALLVEGGADASAADATGWTPLHYAARASSAAGVRLLLAARANPRAATPTRFFFFGARTPLDVLGAGEDALEATIEAGQALLEALNADEL